MRKHTALRPFFTYFGAKWRIAKRYPQPIYDHIIEPFAGAAGYATRYAYLDVTLYESDPFIFGVWDYLIRTSADEIRELPLVIEHVDLLDDVPAGARSLIGLWLNKGSATPHKSPSAWMRAGTHANSFWGPVIRERIASQVDSIRHWRVVNASYETAPDVAATWFIDPPYKGPPGKHYRQKITDYAALGAWCLTRTGQVMVCERDGALWLPFSPFHQAKAMEGVRGKSVSPESLWTNASLNADEGAA